VDGKDGAAQPAVAERPADVLASARAVRGLSSQRPLSSRGHASDVLSPAPTPKQEVTVQAGLHAVSSGLQRLGIVLVATAVAAILAYATLIFVIVVVQAAQSFGH
jgi:hypothetical protein